MDIQKSIDVLNTLIEINNDRIEGYQTAFRETEEADLRNLFFHLAQTSEKCKHELIGEIHNLGGKVEEGTTTAGKFFRVWMDFKAALSGNDRKTILESCESGEDKALDTYDNVIKHHLEDLNTEQRVMLNHHHSLIKADHDKVKMLRDEEELVHS
jgi:uncharacterized protein (TIGR02284 family)